MKILCTNNALDARAGSESYLQTVAPALRQLGHEVELYSPRCGMVAATIREQGFRVHDDAATLGPDFDVIHGQHTTVIAQVRSLLPETPLVFVTHSWFLTIEDPVAELGAACFIAFNDVTLARLRAHAAVGDRPVHRLRQPVDTSFADRARTPLPARARLAVASSRNLNRVLPELRAACERHGIVLQVVGPEGAESPDARREIRAADLVIAIGRTALEGMAAGRAVLVMDEAALGGWVTQESYDRFEADGFTGYHTGPARESVLDLIGGYRPELGTTCRTLAVRNHAVQRHAAELVAIYQQAIGSGPAPARVEPQLTSLTEACFGLEARAVAAEWALAEVEREKVLLDHALVSARAELAAARQELAQVTGSTSWRVTAPVRRLSETAREMLARRS